MVSGGRVTRNSSRERRWCVSHEGQEQGERVVCESRGRVAGREGGV